MNARPWPREVPNVGAVHKVFDRDGNVMHSWFVPSKSEPGAFRHVQFWSTPAEGNWWTCSCPSGHNSGRKLGGKWDRPCRHVIAVTMAEVDDGLPPRPAGRVTPALISAMVD